RRRLLLEAAEADLCRGAPVDRNDILHGNSGLDHELFAVGYDVHELVSAPDDRPHGENIATHDPPPIGRPPDGPFVHGAGIGQFREDRGEAHLAVAQFLSDRAGTLITGLDLELPLFRHSLLSAGDGAFSFADLTFEGRNGAFETEQPGPRYN